jgi:hypothetical protein
VAGHARLSAATRWTALLALVLLLHALALQWLAAQLEQPSPLRPLATPMFTRLLTPEAPAVIVPAPITPSAPRVRRPAISSVAGPRAVAPAAPASAAKAAASAAATAQAPVTTGAAPSLPAASEVVASTPEAATVPAASAPPAATVASAPESTANVATPASPGASAPAALDSWPADTRLSYELGGYYRGDLHGSARVQWQRQDKHYQNRVEIDLTLLASLVLTSQGEVTPQGLVPRVYEELRRSGPRVVRLGDDTVTFNDGKTAPRPEGVQDAASQFVELSHRFASGQETLAVGRSVSLWMARPGGLDLWTYDIVEREVLKLPELGPVEAFRLKPRPIANPRGNITAEIWFAPSLQYLPVRIRVHMGDATFVDLLVEKIEQR